MSLSWPLPLTLPRMFPAFLWPWLTLIQSSHILYLYCIHMLSKSANDTRAGDSRLFISSQKLDSGARSRLVSMTISPLFLGYFFIPARGFAIIMCYYDVGMVLNIPWFHSELVGCDDVTMKHDISSFISFVVLCFVFCSGFRKHNAITCARGINSKVINVVLWRKSIFLSAPRTEYCHSNLIST